VFSCVGHGLSAAKDEVSDVDGVELDSVVMETYDEELVECLTEEGISSDRG